jgi:hypothetical protein
MADDTKNATLRSNLILGTNQVKASRLGAMVIDSTVEVAAGASVASVYTMFRIPSISRVHGLSWVAFDDLASTGSPTIDIGFAGVDENITDDDDALNDGIDVSTAAGTARMIKDHANYGKTAWEILGLSADPGGFLDVIITIKDAATNTGGTVTATLVYSID